MQGRWYIEGCKVQLMTKERDRTQSYIKLCLLDCPDKCCALELKFIVFVPLNCNQRGDCFSSETTGG